MRLVKRLLSFARPFTIISRNISSIRVFGIVFGLVNFAMLIPLLDTLFNSEAIHATPIPVIFSFSLGYFKDLFSYYFHYFSTEKGKWYALAYVCAVIVIATILSNFFRYMAVRVLVRLRMVMLERIRLKLYDRFC